MGVQAILAVLAAIFAIVYFCSDSQASRFRMFAAVVMTTVAYNLWYVNFPAEPVKVVTDNIFNIYYIYVAFMWARKSQERKGTYDQF